MDILGFLIIWGCLGAGVGLLASSRGRSGFGFFLLSFFLSPLLGLIVVLVMSDLNVEAAKQRLREQEHERQLESIRAIANKPTVVTAPTTAAPSRSVADELLKLKSLRDQGVLTEDEFQTQKTSILKT